MLFRSEIPNLSQRANSYFVYLVKRYLFGLEGLAPQRATARERVWLLFYAVASFFYRMFVSATIALLVASKYFVIGVLLAMWSVYLMLAKPVAGAVGWLLAGPELQRKRIRAVVTTVLIVGTLGAVIFWVPAPSWTRTEGVAWAPEDTIVRMGTDATVQEVVATPNSRVAKGDRLIVGRDPELTAQVKVLAAQLEEQNLRYAAAVRDKVLARSEEHTS